MLKPKAVNRTDRENQLIDAAMNLAEQKILEGSAGSTLILHFLRMGSPRETLTRKKLECETDLLETRRESIERETNMEELYQEAVSAMRRYGGNYNEE